ncbi:TetR family transcriptional regulator [Roseibium hamelinense]|uniref:TetR family transcriptional regulator n=1 Tax=Roseibium hamelinense TaxID=150831 RepID=A0A562T971_9HYPH|nr:TetR/AcrR family transcriptional regulator [Roseibium hamelinense]MTI45441.1 TetR/AcrR family transcriptional regulator [Roseibium hamelinense]TWI90187.1 TetR family transcriptional regulator [Roseibium hamelinense]
MAGRPRSFDSSQALDAFVDVFWTKGYQGTSVDDLQNAAGIKRGSFYSTFKSKDAVFSAVLDRYAETVTEIGLTYLTRAKTPRQGIANFLRYIGAFMADNKFRGCLLFSSVSDAGCMQSEEARHLETLTGSIAARIEPLIVQASKDSQSENCAFSQDGLRAFVMTTLLGLNAMARSGQDPKTIKTAADYAAALIEGT